jgi:hypothetical protein
MATVVLMTALRRAGIDTFPDHVLLDQPDLRVVPVTYAERPPLASLRR